MHERAVKMAGKILAGSMSANCTVVQMSNKHALVRVERTQRVPDKFTLSIGTSGRVLRQCTLVRRDFPEQCDFIELKVSFPDPIKRQLTGTADGCNAESLPLSTVTTVDDSRDADCPRR